MPRTCTVCAHAERDAMEDAFIAGAAKRRIAAQCGVSEQAVRRHMREHLPELLALARDAERAARADTLLDRIEALQQRSEAMLDRVERTSEFGDYWRGVSEMRRNLELIGTITKELDRSATLNLEVNPEWLQVEATIINALGGFPEAREAVVSALRELPDRGGNGRV